MPNGVTECFTGNLVGEKLSKRGSGDLVNLCDKLGPTFRLKLPYQKTKGSSNSTRAQR